MAKSKDNLARNKITTPTQKYLDIAEVREDVVIMRDGTLRSVLMVSSMNFALKSEEEQNAAISSYVSFLNNINFPLQIVIQSRELNIDRYLEEIRQKEKEQTNELLKMQTKEYIQYVSELISMGKIMKKNFYVVVPYSPLADIKKGFFARMSELFRPMEILNIKEEKFQQRKKDLMQRVEQVMNGFTSMGLSAAVLDTQSLIELYYNAYNPVTSKNQELPDIDQLRVEKR